ncbi:hypothetical protein [Helicobacter sp. UBA3407]|nr:hypothetical protein [Helicobacter sp. UBA3407]
MPRCIKQFLCCCLENAQKLGCDLTSEICFVAERIHKLWRGQEVLES